MNMHEHDDDFDLRLSKRERLLPQFDAELDGPDADTDRLLIARARMAEHPVQLRSPASITFRAPRWAVPVGLAATLVLSFTLLLQTNPPQVAAPESAPLSSQAVVESAMSQGAIVTDASAPAAMREPHSEPVVPPTVTVNGAVNDSMISRERTSVRAEVVVEPAVLAKAIPAVPPPPPPAMNTAAAADTSADVAAVAMAAAPAPAEAAAGSAAAGSDAERVAGAPLAPHVWLQRIERLRSRGLDTETRQELQAFRQQYPDHPLPEALQALLPTP